MAGGYPVPTGSRLHFAGDPRAVVSRGVVVSSSNGELYPPLRQLVALPEGIVYVATIALACLGHSPANAA